jgi:hypothetical protein
MAQLRSSEQVPAPRRSGDLREQGKKVLVDGGSNINVTFPRTLLGLGVALKELHESDTPFLGIVTTEGEYPLGHIYMPVTFGTPENYRIEFLRFEVASFDCGYNAIIGRPGLAKFMAIPHYSYMILKMPGPQGMITVRACRCFGSDRTPGVAPQGVFRSRTVSTTVAKWFVPIARGTMDKIYRFGPLRSA